MSGRKQWPVRGWETKPPTDRQLRVLRQLATRLDTKVPPVLDRGSAALLIASWREKITRAGRGKRGTRRSGRRAAPVRMTYADGRSELRKPGAFRPPSRIQRP